MTQYAPAKNYDLRLARRASNTAVSVAPSARSVNGLLDRCDNAQRGTRKYSKHSTAQGSGVFGFLFCSNKVSLLFGAKIGTTAKNAGKFLSVCLATAFSLSAQAVQEGVIAPPDVKVIDFMSVNMATGEVAQSLNTVSIGGELGLSHNISLYANFFDANDGKGYRDKFSGMPHHTMLTEEQDGFLAIDSKGVLDFELVEISSQIRQVPAMRVSNYLGSQEFAYQKNGSLIGRYSEVDVSDTSYNFVPIGDKRHALKRLANGDLVWRNPEGVETKYLKGKAGIDSITYPNGFTIYVDYSAVWTNTGFMLKYDKSNSNPNWVNNPKSITAINLAVNNCAPNGSCATSGWPTASFSWPASSPAPFYSDGAENVFSVTDQNGGITEYYYETQNACYFTQPEDQGMSSYCLNKHPGDERFAPRLVGIKSANSKVKDISYTYENDGSMFSPDAGGGPGLHISQWYWKLSTKAGKLIKASNKNYNRIYGDPFSSSQYNYNTVRESAGNRVQTFNLHPGKLEKVVLRKSGTYTFEENSRNFVTSHTPISGPSVSYTYDDNEGGRGNLVAITSNGIKINEASYPDSCDDSNFRFCNKPLWLKDANGNQTDYSYHAQSGQVTTVTEPAVTINGASVRPKTTYVWDEYFATYYQYNPGQTSTSLQQASDGIWLLKQEWSCRTSNALTGSVGCTGGAQDLIKKDYYYGPQDGSQANNLLLRGESVTAYNYAGLEETRVTCYEYDQYGNQIGATLPKGNTTITSATACP